MKKLSFSLLLIGVLFLAGCITPVPSDLDATLSPDDDQETTSTEPVYNEDGELIAGWELPDMSGYVVDGEPFVDHQFDLGEIAPHFRSGDINYFGYAEKIPSKKFFYKNDGLLENEFGKMEDLSWNDVDERFAWYQVGVIPEYHDGKSYDFLSLSVHCGGMCANNIPIYFVYQPDEEEIYYLAGGDEWSVPSFLFENKWWGTVDNGPDIDSFNFPNSPKTLEVTSIIGTTKDFFEDEWDYFDLNAFTSDLAVYHHDYGPIYYNDDNSCYYYRLPDGTVVMLNATPWDLYDGYDWISWNDGSKGQEIQDYSLHRGGGCGFTGGCGLVADVKGETLEVVGRSAGVDLWEMKSPHYLEGYESADFYSENNDSYQANEIINLAYINYASRFGDWSDKDVNDKLPFDQYVKTNPVLFYQDYFGRFIPLIHEDSKVIAECGKPVIYLYPEETMDVQVKVNIDEFTVTEPAHGDDGWFVKASPDGNIYNYADKTQYPYLFWEGIKKGKDIAVNSGAVIKAAELGKFLDESLSELGFSKQEEADFVEFWLPEMEKKDSPYYFISFIGTEEFNRVAPLEIEPAPDTLIRVFMYYEPVWAPFTPAPQKLRSFDREGFTVFEWGGTL
jgi:hypothetical protein